MKRFTWLSMIILLSVSGFCQNREIDSLQALLPAAKGKDRIMILLDLCWNYRFVNADTARQMGLEALLMAKQAGLADLESDALNHIGVTHEAQGNYGDALTYEMQALGLRKKLGDNLKIAKNINDIGIIYDELGDFPKALENYFESRRIFERMKDSSNIAMVLTNIGIVLKEQNEYKKAVGYYRKALNIYQKLGNQFGVAACNANLGSVYLKLSRYDSSLYYSLTATQGFEGQGNRQFLAASLCNAGMAYDRLGQEKRAQECLLKALRLNEVYDNKKELSFVLNYLAEVSRKSGKIPEGIAYARRALAIAEKIGAQEQMMDAHRELAALKALTGDYLGAYEEQRQYAFVKDSLFQQEKSRQIEELQTRYETERKEDEIKLLTQANQIKDFRLFRTQFILIALAALLLAVIGMGYLWRNRVQLKQQRDLESTRALLHEDQLKAVIASQEDERKRFAADLHDGMGQMISALRLNLSHTPVQPSKVEQAVGILNDMNVEIRKIAFNLMPQVLMNSGLLDALTELSNRINRTDKIQTSVQAFDLDAEMPTQQKIALYRICQEWINNIIKYSKATKISIQLVSHDDELVITIENNGPGFDTSRLLNGDGNGWKNINSRLGMIRGTIDIDSSENREGTTLVIRVPADNSLPAS